MKWVRILTGFVAILGIVSSRILTHAPSPGTSPDVILMINLIALGVATGIIPWAFERPWNRPLHGWFWWVWAVFIMLADVNVFWRVARFLLP